MRIVTGSFIIFLLTVTEQISAQSGLSLWYKEPAAQWVEALPVGNGHIGGMVFGRATMVCAASGTTGHLL